MKFWDSSAIVPLCIEEENSKKMGKLLIDDISMVVWWGCWVECVSAFARLRRERIINYEKENESRAVLKQLAESWNEILPCEEIKIICNRLLYNHPLRAADSMQLAAALLWADKSPVDHVFVCLDSRLCDAARKEGFIVVP
jgi:hypothetical protein